MSDQWVMTRLEQWQNGRLEALDELFNRFYDELHGMAAGLFYRWCGEETAEHGIEPTSLLHDAFLKLRQKRQFHGAWHHLG